MLTEGRHVSQVPGDRFRRRFADDTLDLVVWYEPEGAIFGFQLCYDLKERPRALTWTSPRGFAHAVIDDGADGYANRSPILRPGGEYDAAQLHQAFQASATSLPAAERAFVEARLGEYGKCGRTSHTARGLLKEE